MKRSVLIIICDFLVISALTMFSGGGNNAGYIDATALIAELRSNVSAVSDDFDGVSHKLELVTEERECFSNRWANAEKKTSITTKQLDQLQESYNKIRNQQTVLLGDLERQQSVEKKMGAENDALSHQIKQLLQRLSLKQGIYSADVRRSVSFCVTASFDKKEKKCFSRVCPVIRIGTNRYIVSDSHSLIKGRKKEKNLRDLKISYRLSNAQREGHGSSVREILYLKSRPRIWLIPLIDDQSRGLELVGWDGDSGCENILFNEQGFVPAFSISCKDMNPRTHEIEIPWKPVQWWLKDGEGVAVGDCILTHDARFVGIITHYKKNKVNTKTAAFCYVLDQSIEDDLERVYVHDAYRISAVLNKQEG